jgi:hypothetical protein
MFKIAVYKIGRINKSVTVGRYQIQCIELLLECLTPNLVAWLVVWIALGRRFNSFIHLSVGTPKMLYALLAPYYAVCIFCELRIQENYFYLFLVDRKWLWVGIIPILALVAGCLV